MTSFGSPESRRTGMICAACGADETIVKDSRPTRIGPYPCIRRRRRCVKCSHRCTTYEIILEDLATIAGTGKRWRTAIAKVAGSIREIQAMMLADLQAFEDVEQAVRAPTQSEIEE